MSVDNRIPSEPYMELNGVKVYAENDNKPFSEIKFHDLHKVSGRTIGEKLMDKEYNGLGTHGTMGVERVNELIDVDIIKAADDTVAVHLGDGRIVNMDAKCEAGVSHKLGVYGIGHTPELNDLIYGKGVIDGQEH